MKTMAELSNTSAEESPDVSADESEMVEETMTVKPSRMLFPVNNVVGLQQKLNDTQLNLGWVEKLDISVDVTSLKENSSDKPDPAVDTSGENDFKREMSFYNQAMAAVTKAFTRLKKLGIPTQRPDDYLAEMAKSDVHMQKVREKLLSKQQIVERTEKVRNMREQKKQGKKIQREIIQQRKQEKKKMITALKKTKKGKLGAAELLGEKKQGQGKSNKKKKNREYRDTKFGYGGKKKGAKQNTADSSAEYFSSGKSRSSNTMAFNNKKSKFGKQRMTKHRRRR